MLGDVRRRWLARAGRAGHALLRAGAVACGVVLVAVTALGFRLDGRALDVTWVARLAGAAAGARLTVARADLAWERAAPGAPLVLTLNGAVLRRPDGSVLAAARHAALGVPPIDLLRGHWRPVFFALAHASLALRHGPTGFALDAPRPTPAGGARHAPGVGVPSLAPPDRLSLRDVAVTVADTVLRTRWQALIDAEADAVNGPRPHGEATLHLSDGQSAATLTASLAAARAGTHVARLSWSAFRPAGLRLAVPVPLPVLDLPLAGNVRLTFGQAWRLRDARADVRLGAGALRVAGMRVPLAGGTLTLAAKPLAHTVQLLRGAVALACADGGKTPDFTLHGAATRQDLTGTAALSVDGGGLSVARLNACWPAGLARNARAWVLANVTKGRLASAHLDVGLGFGPDSVALTALSGTLAIKDLEMSWLKPVPPLAARAATLTVLSPDRLTIALAGATQTPSDPNEPPLTLHHATFGISGLTRRVQTGTVETEVAGSVRQAVALLSEPRLHLLATHKVPVAAASGQAAVHVSVTLPLDARDTVDQVAIAVHGRLSDVTLPGIMAGRKLDQGALSLIAGNDGLTLDGTCQLAGTPATLRVAADFGAHPAGGVVATAHATGTASAAQLAAAGLPVAGVPGLGIIDGGLGYDATLTEHQDGTGQVALALDLGQAGLAVPPLGWRKPAGVGASASATIVLNHADEPGAVTDLMVHAPGLAVAGNATMTPGGPAQLTLTRLRLGETDAAGQLSFPSAAGQPITVALTGPVLDLAAALAPGPKHATPSRQQARAAAAARHAAALTAARAKGRAWRATLKFARVLTGHGREISDATATLADDGRHVSRADIQGVAGGGRFLLLLAPGAGGRRLTGSAENGGALLHALDISGAISGGHLVLDATYQDARPGDPLVGQAVLTKFRVLGAPAMARLLQGMTLYGLMDVLRGPGLAFTRLVAPFRYEDTVLRLRRARAYSSSLGFTAEGDIDLVANRADLKGTIVPGYFFNSLPGKVPIIGKLFSLEKGGGLFAADYTLDGPLADPVVHINPLSALTPGFLRGIFGGQATAK